MSVFEVLMLLCFGAAWPFSIYKSYKSKTNNGKSIIFLLVVMTGYLSGILHKMFYSYDPVIFLYAINFIMVGTDAILWFRNGRLDRINCSEVMEK